MKIQDLKIFLQTLLIGTIAFIYMFAKALETGITVYSRGCVINLILMARGLYISLDEEAYKKYKLESIRNKEAQRRIWGKYAAWIPYGSLGFLVLALMFAYILPGQTWLSALLIIAACVYAIWVIWYYNKRK